jgi:hypothetical protein
MRPTRLLSTTIVVGVAAAATFFACGGDDGGGGNNGSADAPVTVDAKVFMDAPPAMGLGAPCTASADGSGQGTCEAGYNCLKLGSAAPGWCSKSCTRGAGDACNTGYTGPGVGNCMWDISFGSNSTTYQFCGVICSGTAACGSGTALCDATCPGTMTCTQPIGSGAGAGSACK